MPLPKNRRNVPNMKQRRYATRSETERLENKDLVLPLVNGGVALTLTSTQMNYAWSDDFATRYTTGDQTPTLPAATGSGRKYTYSNSGTGSVTVSADGSDTIHEDKTVIFYKGTITFHDTAAGIWVML
jgi:hypothetical protein